MQKFDLSLKREENLFKKPGENYTKSAKIWKMNELKKNIFLWRAWPSGKALDCGSIMRGFESRRSPKIKKLSKFIQALLEQSPQLRRNFINQESFLEFSFSRNILRMYQMTDSAKARYIIPYSFHQPTSKQTQRMFDTDLSIWRREKSLESLILI